MVLLPQVTMACPFTKLKRVLKTISIQWKKGIVKNRKKEERKDARVEISGERGEGKMVDERERIFPKGHKTSGVAPGQSQRRKLTMCPSLHLKAPCPRMIDSLQTGKYRYIC